MRKCLGLMCLLFVFGGQKKVSVGRAGIDPLTVLYINFSLWSRRLLSNVSRLRIECVVIPNSAVLLLFHLLMYSKPSPKSCLLPLITQIKRNDMVNKTCVGVLGGF